MQLTVHKWYHSKAVKKKELANPSLATPYSQPDATGGGRVQKISKEIKLTIIKIARIQ